jgi:hypothetical protein
MGFVAIWGIRGWYHPGATTMWMKRVIILVAILLSGLIGNVQAQTYTTSKLVRNLLKMGYPLDRDDVIALNKIGMRFDSKNRIIVLERILRDRDVIHSKKDIDYFIKTEVICDALRLLDEHDLPVAYRLIDELNKQKGWEKREQLLLAYMAAKREIRYQSNAAYLLSVLPQYGSDVERVYSGESSLAIIDRMNYLSYLADLFIYKGDTDILNSLITYSSRTHGYPAEYLSHMFVEMFLLRPKVLKVKDVLQKDIFTADERNQRNIHFIVDTLRTQIDLAVTETVPKVSESHTNSGK